MEKASVANVGETDAGDHVQISSVHEGPTLI